MYSISLHLRSEKSFTSDVTNGKMKVQECFQLSVVNIHQLPSTAFWLELSQGFLVVTVIIVSSVVIFVIVIIAMRCADRALVVI